LAQEDVYITFSGPDLCENKVPADAVLLIERELVDPGGMLVLEELLGARAGGM